MIVQPDPDGRTAAPDARSWPPDAVLVVEQLSSTVQELHERAEQLQRALDSRVLIEQAKGILAERYALAPDEAFAALRRGARKARVPLRELAQSVVDSSTTPDEVALELARRQETPA